MANNLILILTALNIFILIHANINSTVENIESDKSENTYKNITNIGKINEQIEEENESFNSSETNEIIKKLEKIQLRLKGEYCSKKDDCMDDENIICLNNKCACLSGYKFSTQSKKCIECPDDWILYKDKCYSINLNKTQSSWKNAQEYCYSLDSDLLSVEYDIFFEFWVAFSEIYNLTNLNFYIGLKYNKNESKWIWSPTGKEISSGFSHWKCLSPENHHALSKMKHLPFDQLECGIVNQKHTIEAIECNSTLFNNTNFICQKRINLNIENYQKIELIKDCVNNNDCTAPRKCVENKCVCSNTHYLSIMADGQSKCIECPKGWILFNDKCFYISSKNEKLTWNKALEYCTNKSSLLINVDSETTFPRDLFRVIKNVSSAQKFWIGGYRNSTSNQFVRFDAKKVIHPNSWWKFQHHLDCMSDLNLNNSDLQEISELSNADRENANCLSASTSILMSGQKCNQKMRFICEKVDLKQYSNVNSLIMHQENDVCSTKGCNKYAKFLLENLDISVDPCESFYEFSCGNFLKKPIPNDSDSISTFQQVEDDLRKNIISVISKPINEKDDSINRIVKTLYSSCMDSKRINDTVESSWKFLLKNQLGGWPLLTNNDNNLSLIELLVRLNKYFTSDKQDVSTYQYLFALIIDKDQNDANLKKIHLKQPSILIPKDYMNNTDKIRKNLKSYLELVLNYLNHTNENYLRDIDDMFEVIKSFSMIQQTLEQQRNVFFIKLSIKELEANLTKFSWKEFFLDGIFKHYNFSINETEPVLIYDWDYLVKAIDLFDYYSQKNKRALANYLIFILFDNLFIKYLPLKYNKARLIFSQQFDGINKVGDKEKNCVDFIKHGIPFALGKIYVQHFFDQKSKKEVLNMLKEITDEFHYILINETEWMDEASKIEVSAKLNVMRNYIGYQDSLFNLTYMNKLHNYNMTEDFFENILIIYNSSYEQYFGELRLKLDDDLIISPAIIDANYYPNANKLYFPAGILQFPFFDSNIPNYINYGSIGYGIGHEITHAFDDHGRYYDMFGNFNSNDSLWTQETLKNFKNKTQCMLKQYQSYYITEVRKNVNGNQTLGENIADNGGLKASYQAYRKWVELNGEEPRLPGIKYTQDQLFFISTAQTWCKKFTNQSLLSFVLTDYHTPSEPRINLMISNNQAFSKAFNCKSGQKSNPVDKCSVW